MTAVSSKRHAQPAAGTSSASRLLSSRGVAYVCLPRLPEERESILVEDERAAAISKELAALPPSQSPIVYAVSGKPAPAWNQLPYLPPHLAEEVLRNRERQGERYVPARRHQLLCAAYHIVYHREDDSALDERELALLAMLGQRDLGEMTLEGLERFLADSGWRPPSDLLARLVWYNPWLRRQLGHGVAWRDPDPGLSVFILRSVGLERGGLDRLLSLLQREGFEILCSGMLGSDTTSRVRQRIRYGRWGRGPWPASGGPPAAWVVAHDLLPISPNPEQLERFPEISNARTLVKEELRRRFNEGYPEAHHCNVVHCSDNSREAREYLSLLAPDLVSAIDASMADRQEDFATRFPVVRDLTWHGRRAKIELIRYRGDLAVKKTFKPTFAEHWRRERRALAELSARIPAIPPLLESDEHWVIMPYYVDTLRFHRPRAQMLPSHVAAQALGAVREVYDNGFALLDARPENLLLDAEHGLKLIDFEFLYEYRGDKPPTFAESFDMAGCPSDFGGEIPRGGACSYARDWMPFVDAPLEDLLAPTVENLRPGPTRTL